MYYFQGRGDNIWYRASGFPQDPEPVLRLAWRTFPCVGEGYPERLAKEKYVLEPISLLNLSENIQINRASVITFGLMVNSHQTNLPTTCSLMYIMAIWCCLWLVVDSLFSPPITLTYFNLLNITFLHTVQMCVESYTAQTKPWEIHDFRHGRSHSCNIEHFVNILHSLHVLS